MKDILLNMDDSINEEGIKAYINTYGIDTSYDNKNSVYYNQTLLNVAVSSNEIKPDIKLKLATYLLNKGAKLTGCNLFLMDKSSDDEPYNEKSIENDSANKTIFETARHENTPILIKQTDHFMLYGDPQGKGIWKVTDIINSTELKALPFKANNTIMLKDTDPRLTSPVIKSLKSGHTQIDNPKLDGELISLAISEGDLDLANLLLKKKDNIIYINFKGKNIIDLALESKNEEMVNWALKNANACLNSLSSEQFKKYYEEIIHAYPKLASSLKQASDDYIYNKFSRLGLINAYEAALVVAAKTRNKQVKDNSYKNSIFVITSKDIPEIIKQIQNLLTNDTLKNIIKFQIIHFTAVHAIFGEFTIDKTNKPPTVQYLHCDPLPLMTYFSEIVTSNFRKEISPLANIEIYDSNMTIQKGVGCSYFSIDGAMMLATPPDRDYAPNVVEYMKNHGVEKNKLFEEKNIKYIQSDTLPTRFIRGLQYINDTPESPVKGLDSLVFNSPEKNTIVNKNKKGEKGETAEISIRKDLQKRRSRLDPKSVITHNIRAERKMKQYGNAVRGLIEDNDTFSAEFSNLIDEYRIKGLSHFCEAHIERRKEQNIKLK